MMEGAYFLMPMLISLVVGLGPWVLAYLQYRRVRDMGLRIRLLESTIVQMQERLRADLREEPTSAGQASEQPGQAPFTTNVAAEEAPEQVDHDAIPAPPLVAPFTIPAPHLKRSRAEVELLIGGTWLSRIGAVALVIGMTFFLKYAFDNGWFSEWMRVAIGAVSGSLLLVGAKYSDRKGLRLFAQGLAGAGVPILYLSVYAAYGFYGLVDHSVAVGAMCVVTAVAVYGGLNLNSIFITGMAAIGGFCTPAWLSTGQMNELALFSYVIILALGLFCVACLRPRWITIDVIAHIGVIAWWWVWAYQVDRSALDGISQVTLLASICLIIAIAYHYVCEQRAELEHITWRRGILVGYLILMSTYTISTLGSDIRILEFIAVNMGVCSAAMALLYRRADNRVPASIYTIASLVVLFWGVGREQDGFIESIGWSLLGTGCLFTIRRTEDGASRIAALSVLSMGLLAAIGDDRTIGYSELVLTPVLNLRTAALLIAALSTLSVSRFMSGSNDVLSRALKVLRIVGYLSIVLCIHREVFDGVASDAYAVAPGIGGYSIVIAEGHAIASLFSVIVATMIAVVHRKLRDDMAAFAGLAAVVVAVFWWCTHVSQGEDPSSLPPFTSMRALTGLVIIITLSIGTRAPALAGIALPIRTMPTHSLQTVFAALLVAYSFVYLTVEVVWNEVITAHVLSMQGGDMATELAAAWDRFHLRMSATWIVYSIVLMVIGFLRRLPSVRIASLLLLLLSICKVFLYDLSFLEQPYRIVSFIALGVILLMAGFLYQRYRHIIFTPK